MSDAASTPSADAEATLAFMTGVSADGTLIMQDSGWSWDFAVPGPPLYDATGWAHKWGGGAAGTPATVTYALDGSSNFTAGEQGIIAASLALWSAESGISFVPVASVADAQVAFYRYGSSGDAGAQPGVYTVYQAPAGTVGASSIPATGAAAVSLDTSQSFWSRLDSFTAYGGYGVDSLVHEIGHVLGLFHAGPYNGAVAPLLQQFNATDSRQWSLMSYIDPWMPAKYSSDYTYKNTNWGFSSDGFVRVPTTPMPLDILAAQRLYGLPTDTPLAGGQVFGFHCNIGGAIRPFFDFTTNTAPVVTLWDEGAGNALDLSGFTGAATVSLEPGTFSSADGMTNNIGIAYGTRIDRLLGPAGGETVTLNGDSDTVQATGGWNAAVLTAAHGLYAVAPTGTESFVVRAATGVVDLLLGVQELGFTGGDNTVSGAGAGTYDLSGGGNLLFLGDRPASVRSAGGDTIVAGGSAATVAATGSVGSLVFGTGAALTVTSGAAAATVVTGRAGGVVYGGGSGGFVWADGPLVYRGGFGAATVAAGPTANATVFCGGGGLFFGGGAGHNVLDANGRSATLVGGGDGDRVMAQNTADNLLVAGPGAETLYATGATGRNVFFAGTGTVAMFGGSGENQFVAGAGQATITAGLGPALLECFAGHAGGELSVLGWNAVQDQVGLNGYAADAVAQAVAGATIDTSGSTVVTLSDHTRIVFANVTGISSGWFV